MQPKSNVKPFLQNSMNKQKNYKFLSKNKLKKYIANYLDWVKWNGAFFQPR